MLVGPGTVFVPDSGEGLGEDRLLLLDAGVIEQLVRVTGCVYMVLEHRYVLLCLFMYLVRD
jgi:hypothetical protein